MKITHLMVKSNISVLISFIKFVNENFDSDSHNFVIFGEKTENDDLYKNYKNVKIIKRGYISTFELLKIIKKSDILLIHFLKLKNSTKLFLLLNRKLFRKIVWISWGADLYQWEKKYEGGFFKNLKNWFVNKINYFFRKKVNYFVGIFPPDIEFFNKNFSHNAKTFYSPYVGDIYTQLYKTEKHCFTSLDEKIKSGKTINIQIGHSSTKILNHIEVLEVLEKFKTKKIKIFIPLSYGDMEYADFVEKRALELFGEKVVCMRGFLKRDEYLQFLENVDIAIFNTFRQIGLGNIHPLLFMGKKIFLPENSIMYKFFRSRDINIKNYNEIKKMDFNQFTQPINMEKAKEYIQEYVDFEKRKKMWEKVFNESEKGG